MDKVLEDKANEGIRIVDALVEKMPELLVRKAFSYIFSSYALGLIGGRKVQVSLTIDAVDSILESIADGISLKAKAPGEPPPPPKEGKEEEIPVLVDPSAADVTRIAKAFVLGLTDEQVRHGLDALVFAFIEANVKQDREKLFERVSDVLKALGMEMKVTRMVAPPPPGEAN